MGHEHAGHYKTKHSDTERPSDEIINEVKSIIKDNCISCADAHSLAEKLSLSPQVIGVAMDFCEARITKCQLGLFGHSPKKRIVSPLPAEDVGELEEKSFA